LGTFTARLIIVFMNRLIAYITTFYPTPEKPWHGIFFRDHAEALAEFEDVALMHLQTPSLRQQKSIFPRIETQTRNNVYTVRANQPVLTHRFQPLIQKASIKAGQKTLRQISEHYGRQPDCLIAQCVLPAGNIAMHLSAQTGIPYGVIDHFSFLESMFQHQGESIRKVYHGASFVGAVSPYLAKKIDHFLDGNDQIPVIGNVLGRSFEQTEVHQVRCEKTDPFKWLFIARDDEVKGVDILGEALKLLPKDKWRLTIVGKGEFDALKSAGYSDNIIHKTGLKRKEMLKVMQEHHALISTSRIETFGLAILEMLSQGRPVVATRCGGPEEFVTPDCGILVAKESPGETTRAMKKIMENYDAYSPKKISRHAREGFGSRSFYNKMKQIFNEADI